MDRWHTAAAAAWNRHLSALVSFTTWDLIIVRVGLNAIAGLEQGA
ncbi:hypothetical protein [Streptosporangium roseum]